MDKREGYDLLEALDAIDPATLDYTCWTQVGMALKYEGFDVREWDDWSRRDSARYHPNDCDKKWNSFQCDTSNPVTGGTLVSIAKTYGWAPGAEETHIMGWDDIIDYDPPSAIDPAWLESEEISEPSTDTWKPTEEIITYLETLFESSETVGFVTKSWEKDGRYLPTSGQYLRTAGDLIEGISKCKGDIGAVLGDYNPEAGVWIRFNPLDGHGIKNSNVTEFRYALVESDSMEIDKQIAIIKQLELPVACLVHSGNKSVHAIVKVDAPSYDEYRKRVDYLYSVCKRNGLDIDAQNKNPSRLSRMPGVYRKGVKQYLIATSIGKPNWATWYDWNEEINDGLPEIESFDFEAAEQLKRPEALIEDIVNPGCKMLISGPSKIGKSQLTLERCIAYAEGRRWLGKKCQQGKVLYVNLENDLDDVKMNLIDIYKALGIAPKNFNNIHFLDLNGKDFSLSSFKNSIIRRTAKQKYLDIIIDPLYQIMEGDENSAKDVTLLCKTLDVIKKQTHSLVSGIHHYSKGSQAQKFSSDRASGSGVLTRNMDAHITLTQLEVTEKMREAWFNSLACEILTDTLDEHVPDWREQVSADDTVVARDLRIESVKLLPNKVMNSLIDRLDEIETKTQEVTACRIEGDSLRSFKHLTPINVWFSYPIHIVDYEDILTGAKLFNPAKPSKPETAKSIKKGVTPLEEVVALLTTEERPPTKKEVANYYGKTLRTISTMMREQGFHSKDFVEIDGRQYYVLKKL